MTETESIEDLGGKPPSTFTALSYSSYMFWFQLMTGIWDGFIFYFYEVVLGLNVILVFAALSIFTLWDAFNEIILGYLTDRTTKLTRKWGKRFPWIMLGVFPGTIAFVLCFTPPITDGAGNPLAVFAWLIFTTCLYDTCLTLGNVNITGLFPDKFRSDKARRKIQAWSAPLSLLSLPVASLMPMLLITWEDPAGYATMAIVSGIILFVFAILGIYGVTEDKETIDRYYEVKPEAKEKFFTTMRTSFKQRAFVIMVIFGYGYGLVIGAVQGSIPYAIDYIIGGDPGDFMFVMAGLIIGAIVASIIWPQLVKRFNNNKKAYIIASLIYIVVTLLFGLTFDLITAILFTAFFGFGLGAFWILNQILGADMYDERAVLTGTDQRGATVGVLGFLGRFGRFIQIGMFTVVHIVTGFNPDPGATQTPLALFGIRLHMAILPALFFAVVVLIFWKFWPLTTERVQEVKEKLLELGI
jgi:GPH family glycoside/pentoside/hexuronide:cation symporter